MQASIQKTRRAMSRGQGLVEFALIFPVLLWIMMAIIDFGRVMAIYAQISGGARDAVRYGAVKGTIPGHFNWQDCGLMRDLVRSSSVLMDVPDANIVLRFDDGVTPRFSCEDASNPGSVRQGDRIIAEVNIDVPLLTPLINNLWPTLPVRFTAAHTIIKQGVDTGPTTTPWPTFTPIAPPTATFTPCSDPFSSCYATDTPPPTNTFCPPGQCPTETSGPPTSTFTPVPPTATPTPCDDPYGNCPTPSITPTCWPPGHCTNTPPPTYTPAPPTDTPPPTNTYTPGPSPTCWPPGHCTNTPAPTNTPRP